MPGRAQLIESLASDLAPARRLRAPSQLGGIWLIGSWVFVVSAILLATPMRPGAIGQLMGSPRFASETLLGLAVGVAAAATLFAAGVPGAIAGRRMRWVAGALILWAGAYVYGVFDPALPPSTSGARPYCVFEVLLYGLPTLVAGLLLLRRLAPLRRAAAGALAGAAAGAIPGLLMQLSCMYVPSHILLFHLAPILVLSLCGALLGPLVLRRI